MSRFWSFAVLLVALAGCSKDAEPVTRERAPRPVSVIKLRQSDPARSLAVTGVVGSWKTEDLGFEVSGRINYVIEPEQNVSGPIEGDGTGQFLADIDSERYQSAVVSANAKVAALQKQMEAASIEELKVVPAQLDAAKAAETLAKSEFQRAVEAFKNKAISEAEYAKYKADEDGAVAKVTQLKATQGARSADVASLAAQIEQAQATLKDAELNLEDCKLYAPFSGQIAEVHVIPGGTVQRGEPVVTVQMMDPVKIEFEVSAERARQIKYKDTLEVILTRPDGSTVREEAVIFMTDAAADPSTRTFTITLLLRNRQVPTDLPDDVDPDSLAKTHDLWKCLSGLFDASDDYFIATDAIHSDDQGNHFFLKVIDPVDGRSRGPMFKVEKVRVTPGDKTRGFLGVWKFKDVVIDDPSTFDITKDRVLGRLVLPEGMTKFSGDTVLFEREPWLVRPGDLAKVDLIENRMPRGFYVPIDAINEKSGKHYVFVVFKVDEDAKDNENVEMKVRRVEVSIADGPNTLKRIAAAPDEDEELTEDTQIVLGGVHYLKDGELVNVAAEVEGN